MDKPIVFVIGVGRSGTTLLQLFLASHPAISFMPELQFVRRFLLSGVIDRQLAGPGKRDVATLLEEDAKIQRLPFSITELIDGLHEPTSKALFENIAIQFDTSETQWLGCKDARLIEYLPDVIGLWPNAKFVHIFRDPRDVLASRKKADWSKDYPLWRNLVAGRVQLDAVKRFRRESPDRICDVKYEELLGTPERVAQDLCEFLDLEFSPQMLEFNNHTQGLVFADEMQWKQNLLSPLMQGNFDKWKKELSPYEIAVVESTFQRDFAERGYTAVDEARKLSLGQRWQVMAYCNWIRAVAKMYQTKRALVG